MKKSEMIRLMAEAIADADYGWRSQILGEEKVKTRLTNEYSRRLAEYALDAAEKNGMKYAPEKLGYPKGIVIGWIEE